jgi:uncharacterized protein
MKQLFTAFICFWAYLAAAQTYADSIRQLRVLHFSELTDPAKKILTEDEIAHFEGLDYFLIDTTYIIEARFIRKKGKKFKMPTSTSRSPVYRRFGFVQFQLNGMEHQLTVFQNIELKRQEGYANYLFLPFRDSSSGNESYGGGRYLDLVIPKGKKIILDFNLAYNPYCVYSDRYSCPIPPEENRLKTAIRAGEKKPKAY